MEHPKTIGDRCTLAVMLALESAGYRILVPFGENIRYDLVIDDGQRLSRVQCKSGRLRGGAVRFAVCSTYGHHKSSRVDRRDYHGQVDYFAIYCMETQAVYLVPIEELSVRVQGALRVDPPRNRQKARIRLAEQFEIGKVATERSEKAPNPAFARAG